MCFTWLVDKILQTRDSKTKVKVLVHEAFFLDDLKKEPYFFVKVVNLSHIEPITITHVWVKDSPDLEILNSETPLPYKLEKTDTWETWFKRDQIKDTNNIFNNVRIALSSGKEYKSRKNIKVRPRGFTANKD
jgi:hypothetical protein